MERVITESEIKEISDKATELYNTTDLTVIESLRIAKEMVLSEKKIVEEAY